MLHGQGTKDLERSQGRAESRGQACGSNRHLDGGRGDGPPKESEKESRGKEENPEIPKTRMPGAESTSRTEGQLCPELMNAKEEEEREGPTDLATRWSSVILTRADSAEQEGRSPTGMG